MVSGSSSFFGASGISAFSWASDRASASSFSERSVFPASAFLLRESLLLSYGQMAQLIGVKRSQYQNWEAPDRGVSANCVPAVQKLMAMSPAELQSKIEALKITPAGRFLKKDKEA